MQTLAEECSTCLEREWEFDAEGLVVTQLFGKERAQLYTTANSTQLLQLTAEPKHPLFKRDSPAISFYRYPLTEITYRPNVPPDTNQSSIQLSNYPQDHQREGIIQLVDHSQHSSGTNTVRAC